MTAQTWLIQACQDLQRSFAGIRLQYAYDALVDYHVIEVQPETIRRANKAYKAKEMQVYVDFAKLFPDQQLLIGAPSAANDMTATLYKTV